MSSVFCTTILLKTTTSKCDIGGGRMTLRSGTIEVPYIRPRTPFILLYSLCLKWSNRNDYDALRQGNRVVSLGEKPYFDPKSKSRREVLGLKVPIVVWRPNFLRVGVWLYPSFGSTCSFDVDTSKIRDYLIFSAEMIPCTSCVMAKLRRRLKTKRSLRLVNDLAHRYFDTKYFYSKQSRFHI